MFDLSESDAPRPRCLFTSLELPSNMDIEQASTKKKPFSIILNHEFTHTIELLLPKPAASTLQQALSNGRSIGTLQYAKVHMKLSDVITGDFFNQYIKAGNIAMLSAGRRGIDPIYSLSAGVLRLDLDRPTFERLGLPGHPIPHAGRKHVKARYGVELDLRLPAMVRGKPGFDRVVRAFERVLDDAVTWLFCDLNGPTVDASAPIQEMGALMRRVEGDVEELKGIKVPSFAPECGSDELEEVEELLEWVGLTLHGSPRVRADDRVDPLLSRYQVPTWLRNDDGEDAKPAVQDLVKVSWRGLITPRFALEIFKTTTRVSRSRWMAFNASQFDGEAYTILVTEDRCLVWEYKD